MSEHPIAAQHGVATGHYFDTTVLRLDLYRLNCIFEASKSLGQKCSSDETPMCPIRDMLKTFEYDEISRLIITISVFGRTLDDKLKMFKNSSYHNHNEIYKAISKAKKQSKWHTNSVGKLIPDVNKPTSEDLTLRESFNKVLHANRMNFEVVETTEGLNDYLEPYLYLYGKKNKENWKATLDVYEFIRGTYIMTAYL